MVFLQVPIGHMMDQLAARYAENRDVFDLGYDSRIADLHSTRDLMS
jgi:hypothetical protein